MIEQKQYDRLPSYVKEELASLKRQRDAAVQQLREYEDSQTPSDFWIEDRICDGPGSPRMSKKFIQTYEVCMAVGGDYVSLRRTLDGDVYLTAGWRELLILPRASNQVEIRIGR